MDNEEDKINIENGSGAELGGFGDTMKSENTGEPMEEQPPAPAPHTEKPANLSENIANRLGNKSTEGEHEEGKPKPAQTIAFDLNSLSLEQLQSLKQKLAVIPDQIRKTVLKPTITLREVQGKLVVGFKQAYLALVDDPVNQKKVEAHIIPVLFLGETEYSNVRYKEFMNSPRVACEVVSKREDAEEIPEGITRSRITGTEVEMIRKVVTQYFTIKLPSGETMELEAKLANA